MIKNDTFGNSSNYRMLPALTDLLNNLQDKDRAYLTKFISDFNMLLKNKGYTEYILRLIKKDYFERVDKMKYDDRVRSYLKCFIKARIKRY